MNYVDDVTGSEIVMDICVALMENGLDLSKIEKSMEELCNAFNIKQINSLVMPRFLSLTFLSGNGEIKTISHKCKAAGTNLQKIEVACSLIEAILNDKLELREIVEQTTLLRLEPRESWWIRIVAYIGVAVSFSFAFAGRNIVQFKVEQLIGMFLSAVISAILIYYADKVLERAKIGEVFSKFFISIFLTTVLCGIESALQTVDIKIYTHYLFMGSVMLIVSGVKFTNGARDLFSGNVSAAIIQISESLLSTIGIVMGVLVAQRLMNTQFSIVYEESKFLLSKQYLCYSVLLTGVETLFFSMYFRVDRSHLLLCSIVGAITWLVYSVIENIAIDSMWSAGLVIFVPNFVAAMIATLISESIGKSQKWPTMLILFPAIVALIPGGSLYRTIYEIFQSSNAPVNTLNSIIMHILSEDKNGYVYIAKTVLTNINNTIYAVAGLSLGILFVATITRVENAFVGSFDRKTRSMKKTKIIDE